MADLRLVVHTARRRYLVRQDDVFAIRATKLAAATPEDLAFELGSAFDPVDADQHACRLSLMVPVRRKLIAVLVAHTDLLEQPVSLQALPLLVAEQLAQQWVQGVALLDDQPVIALDLRAVVRSLLLVPPKPSK